MTPHDFAVMVEWEGGIAEAFACESDIELITDSDALLAAFEGARWYYRIFARYERQLQSLLPEI
jgi:hypothetical protein